MSNYKNIIKNNKLLIIVVLSYFGLFIFNTPMGIGAIKNSSYYFKEMLIVMPVIMLLTALLEAWVPKKVIEKNLGKDSGIKGSIFSFLLGSFSAGPVYAAFPVCVSLLKKGASISNIVILLSTWAVVKVPMLANEAKFLSPKFMFTRWVLTTISIFIIGYITSKFVKRDEVMKIHENAEENLDGVSVKAEYCIGCGICTKLCPEVFEMKDGKAVVKDSTIVSDTVNQSADRCPAKAINISI